jgi:hypothetical protein
LFFSFLFPMQMWEAGNLLKEEDGFFLSFLTMSKLAKYIYF